MTQQARFAWLIVLFLVQLLYFPINRTMQGGVILDTPWDDLVPFWPVWVVPYLLSIIWWQASFIWAAWKMDDKRYRALVIAALGAMLTSYFVFIVFPTCVERPTLQGDSWDIHLLRFLYNNDRLHNAFPSGHTYITVLICLFWWHWRPRLRWLWAGIAVMVILSTLFTGQHNLLDPLGGIVWAWLGYLSGWWWVSRRPKGEQLRQRIDSLWFWRAGWAGSLLLALGLAGIYTWLPADGATGDLEGFTPQGFRVQWLLEERSVGLRVGDLIVNAEGYTADDWLDGAPRGPEWRVDGVVTYQILRNGRPMALEIHLAPVPFLSILGRWTSQLLGALAFFFIGTFVFWKHPEELSARLFMLLCTAVALQYWGDAYNFQYSSLPWRWPFWVQLIYEHGTYALSIATVCYFALVFPTRHPLVERFPHLIPAVVYGSYPVIVIGAMALSPTWNAAMLVGSRAAWFVTILLIGVAIAAGVRSVRAARDPVTRAQTRWILWTCGVGLAVLMPGYVLPLILTGSSLLPHPVIMLVIAAMPVSLAFAILRYRLFDIDVVINRSLVYGALTVLLAAVFGGSLLAFSRIFQTLMGDQQSAIAMTASALVVGAVFQPMRRHLQRFVDQRFYGIYIDYQKRVKPPPMRAIGAPVRPQLNDYTELELVGHGGAAAVYRARHPSLNRTVAIKILSEHLIQESNFRKRFEREARVIASLRHPSIVQVYDFGEEDGLYYMVMEYIAGPDLGSLLRERGRMPLAEALPLVHDIASALDYAHGQGLVHRDIKPSNVMLDPIAANERGGPYRAVLMDFGLAKIVGGSTRLTQTGMVGTLSYIAPEQIQAAADVDRRADIYAFGVMTYEMLVGELPFRRQHPGALLIAHLTQPPPDPRSLAPDLSETAARALHRALAKNPNERYPTAGAFANALELTGGFGQFG